MKRLDLTDKRFGKLVAKEYVGDRKWKCKCDCGNETIVFTSNLKNGHTTSCGCASKETAAINGRKSLKDLTNQRFGLLKAIKYVSEKKKWECECECGNICYVAQNNLTRTKNGTKSCGCLVNLDSANAENIVQGTNAGNVIRQAALPNSSTGIKGVHYSKSRGTYVATIGFQGKHYTLLVSNDINKCIAARKEAEKRVFGDFIEWYNNKKSAEE